MNIDDIYKPLEEKDVILDEIPVAWAYDSEEVRDLEEKYKELLEIVLTCRGMTNEFDLERKVLDVIIEDHTGKTWEELSG